MSESNEKQGGSSGPAILSLAIVSTFVLCIMNWAGDLALSFWALMAPILATIAYYLIVGTVALIITLAIGAIGALARAKGQ